jgi:tetratricopeptide (TPR) repeat protein
VNTESDQSSLRKEAASGLTCFLEFCQARASSVTGICVFLAAITLLCYWPITHHAFINFDDHEYITENVHVKAGLTWQGVAWAFCTGSFCSWHPLTWISHMLDYELYGLNAGGHHLTNLLFHIANSLLLFLLLNRMTGALWRSAFVAALFAWHPLHVESVAWASERKDVLSTFFFLLTLGVYARYAESKGESPKSKVEPLYPSSIIHHPSAHAAFGSPRSSLYYLLALFLFALALMSKPMVVTLPFVLLLLDYWPLQRFELSASNLQLSTFARLAFEKVPFFVMALAASIVTFLVQKQGGAVASLTTIPFYLRVVNALMSYLRYISKAVVPMGLAPFYGYEAHWHLALVLGATILLAVWSFLFFLKAKQYPYLPVGWCWFLGTLVPTIGLVQVGSQSMADRYMYIPSIGLFVLVIWGLWDFRWLRRKTVVVGAGVAALAAYSIETRTQVQYWQNGVALFGHALEVTSGNYFAYAYIGKAYDDSGEKEKALAYYSESVRLSPHYVEGQYNLGTLLLEMGRIDEAAKCLTQAITDGPRFARAYNNLGKALLSQGSLDEGVNRLTQAIKLQPDWPEAHYNLGTALLTQSKPAAAIGELSEALRLNPGYAEAHMNFAIASINLGKTNEGLAHLADAVRLAPDNPEAHFNFGLALLERDKPAEAASQFAAGLHLRPDDGRMRSRLAQALASSNAQGQLGPSELDATQARQTTYSP